MVPISNGPPISLDQLIEAIDTLPADSYGVTHSSLEGFEDWLTIRRFGLSLSRNGDKVRGYNDDPNPDPVWGSGRRTIPFIHEFEAGERPRIKKAIDDTFARWGQEKGTEAETIGVYTVGSRMVGKVVLGGSAGGGGGVSVSVGPPGGQGAYPGLSFANRVSIEEAKFHESTGRAIIRLSSQRIPDQVIVNGIVFERQVEPESSRAEQAE